MHPGFKAIFIWKYKLIITLYASYLSNCQKTNVTLVTLELSWRSRVRMIRLISVQFKKSEIKLATCSESIYFDPLALITLTELKISYEPTTPPVPPLFSLMPSWIKFVIIYIWFCFRAGKGIYITDYKQDHSWIRLQYQASRGDSWSYTVILYEKSDYCQSIIHDSFILSSKPSFVPLYEALFP